MSRLHVEMHGTDWIHNHSVLLRTMELYGKLSRDTDVEVSVNIYDPHVTRDHGKHTR